MMMKTCEMLMIIMNVNNNDNYDTDDNDLDIDDSNDDDRTSDRITFIRYAAILEIIRLLYYIINKQCMIKECIDVFAYSTIRYNLKFKYLQTCSLSSKVFLRFHKNWHVPVFVAAS